MKPKRSWVVAPVRILAVLSVALTLGCEPSEIAKLGLKNGNLRTALKSCPTADVVPAGVYFTSVFGSDTVVLNIKDVSSSSARKIDLVHLLMQFASKIKLTEIRRVVLAHQGREKFYVDASDLKPLAESYANDGRIWAFNNLPAKCRTMSGSLAFDSWSGGWLGVLQKQSADLNAWIGAWVQ